MSKVWMLVTLFNRAQNLPGLFARLDKQDFTKYSFVLIDHGTQPIKSDQLPEYVVYLRSSPDKWWGGAINDGLRYVLTEAKATDEDFVILQNDDVVFKSSLISDLVQASIEKNYAVVGALTVNKETGLIMDADNAFSILHAKHLCRFRGKPVESIGRKPIASDILKGRGVIYPVKVIRQIGFINEKLTRRSDPEYAYRAKKAGVGVFIDPRIIVESTMDPRTLLTGKVTLKDVWNHLFSARSYSNLPDAFFYFYTCLDPVRGTYCVIVHTCRTVVAAVGMYLRSRFS